MSPIQMMEEDVWVDYIISLIIRRKEREAREKRDEDLAKLLRPENETDPS
jgi:hypothetical protein